jgi:hypothetical protein
MIQLSKPTLILNSIHTVDYHRRNHSLTWILWILLVLGASALLGMVMVYSTPKPSYIAWLLFMAGFAIIIYQPRYGVYLILFLSLVGDKQLIYWYPFQLNFSSGESLLFLHQSLIFSPLEVYLALTLLSWFIHGFILRKLSFNKGDLFWPAMIFMAFVIFGLVYGLGRGGNVNVGLWEARPIFYLPFMLILTSNLITERDHILTLMGLVISALFIEGLIGVSTYFSVLRGGSSILAATFMEHSAAVHMSSFFIFILALWLYKGPLKARILTLLMGIPVLYTFFIIQRRAALFALLLALVFMAFILYSQNQRAFWIIVPTLTILFTIYLIAFWNNTGMVGFPARAIKSQVTPHQASLRDQYSNIYRVMENYNISYTIRQAPLTGIGFGQMFYMVIPLPDISFFVWWRYIPHNTIGWIWMKTGIGGFVSMLFLGGLTIMTGIRTLFRMPDGMMKAVILTGTLYILVHFLFAYGDMSWDSQSMIYIGTMIGLIGFAESLVAQKD